MGQMKNLALVIIAVIGVNFAYDEYMFRSSAHDVIVETFKTSAADACYDNARGQNIGGSHNSWRNPASLKLVIGKSNLDVYFWQIDSSMWNAKYRNPYIFIVADENPAFILCEYDILHRTASVHRM